MNRPQTKLLFNVVGQRPHILWIVEPLAHLGDDRRFARPGDTLEKGNHLPGILIVRIKTQTTDEYIHPIHHLLREALVLHDGLNHRRLDILPCLNGHVLLWKLLVKILATHNRRIEVSNVI